MDCLVIRFSSFFVSMMKSAMKLFAIRSKKKLFQTCSAVVVSGSTMEGFYVYVCHFPNNVCLPCGVIADTDSGQWAQLYCTGGWITGNRIRILHSYNQLQFCEVHVFGMEMGEFFHHAVQM